MVFLQQVRNKLKRNFPCEKLALDIGVTIEFYHLMFDQKKATRTKPCIELHIKLLPFRIWYQVYMCCSLSHRLFLVLSLSVYMYERSSFPFNFMQFMWLLFFFKCSYFLFTLSLLRMIYMNTKYRVPQTIPWTQTHTHTHT